MGFYNTPKARIQKVDIFWALIKEEEKTKILTHVYYVPWTLINSTNVNREQLPKTKSYHIDPSICNPQKFDEQIGDFNLKSLTNVLSKTSSIQQNMLARYINQISSTSLCFYLCHGRLFSINHSSFEIS